MPIEPEDVRVWAEGVLWRATRVFEKWPHGRAQLKESDRRMADSLMTYRDTLAARLDRVLPKYVDARKVRHHGDFHLGQMLIVKDDVCIIDFEGEPRRGLAERRLRAPAARDVKAFDEIEYELSHRSDWLRVPLAGALRILSRHAGVTT